jgi:hypothetical protein
MKKPSIGLIIFGVIFILIGLSSLKGALTYFACKAVAPHIHNAVITKIIEAEDLIKTKKDGGKNVQRPEAKTQLQQIKNEMKDYKEKYIKGNLIPVPMMIFAAVSLFTAAIFMYTGISILQLKPFTRKLISMSFLAGLVCSFAFLWGAGSSTYFITKFTDRFAEIFAMINGNIFPKRTGIMAVVNLMLSEPIQTIIVTFYIVYLAFMSITSIFFARPKIKELFK